MYAILLTAALIGAVDDAPVLLAGVKTPRDGFHDRVVQIGPNSVQELDRYDPGQATTAFAEHLKSQLPADDRGLWYVTVFADTSDPASKRLIEDFRTNPSLRQLASWAKLEHVDFQQPADKARWKAWEIRKTPTVWVYPHPDNPRLPYVGAVVQSGYGGDAEMLARNVYAGIRSVYKKHRIEDCPGPYCPTPNPYQPQPNPPPYQPSPSPWRPIQPDDGFPMPPPLPVAPEVDNSGFSLAWVGELVHAALWLVLLVVSLVAAALFLRAAYSRLEPRDASNDDPVPDKPAGGGRRKTK